MSKIRSIVVTGASSGIGRASAHRLADDGFAVVVGYNQNEAAAQSLVTDIQASGGTAEAVGCDFSAHDDGCALFESADRIGALAGLVNAAAIPGRQVDFLELTAEEVEEVWRVNFMGTLQCCQHAVDRMATSRGGNGGRIVNFSSQVAESGGYRRVAYSAFKGAVETLTVSLASEFASEQILVTALSPGIIATSQVPTDNKEWRKSAEARIPLGRLGEPEEVAATVSWLMSPGASYITGTTIPINGGRRA